MTLRSVSIWQCVQGQSAELNLYCVGCNTMERSVLGWYIGDLIRNYAFANAIQYCINFEEGGEQVILIISYLLKI